MDIPLLEPHSRRGDKHTCRYWSPPNSGIWISVELLVTASQIIASVVVLLLSRDEKPQAPLFEWIVGYASGCVATLPLLYLRYRCRNNQHTEQESVQQTSTPYIAISVLQSSEEEDHHASGATTRNALNRRALSARFSVLVDHLKMALDCFFAVWFFVGNVWIFGGHSSSSDAPNLYRLCIVFLTFSCIGYAVASTICCCLPCIPSVLGFQEDLAHTGGATLESISGLPTYKFKLKNNRCGGEGGIKSDAAGKGGTVGVGTEKEHIISGEDIGYEVSVKEIDSLLSPVEEKKGNKDQEEAESNMSILLDFLHCLRKQKIEELNEIQNDLQYIEEDISSVEIVEGHRIELDESAVTEGWPSSIDKQNSGVVYSARSSQGIGSSNYQNKEDDIKASMSRSDPQTVTQSRKRRIHTQFNNLQECYLQKRRDSATQTHKHEERDMNAIQREGYHVGLEDFQSVLTTFTRYSHLRVIAELKHGDHSYNVVSSIEFDRDDELFATAGVSRCIRVFDFASVVSEPEDAHCPIVEMSTQSKLSCLSWNKYTKNHIASSDYEGIITVWDVTTQQSVMEFGEHEKRAWSVDFSHTEPSMLVSGSDDCKVKVWCTKQEASVLNINMKVNVCCVKYNPDSSNYIAVGLADHNVYYYDLRNTSAPLNSFSGHNKAVSYVKFLSNNELVSASTDSTLCLWDVKKNLAVRTFSGHTNKKNFVGLSVNNEYIACGSETNEVYVYHKELSNPAACHKFDMDHTAGSHFISAMCWKSDSATMLTANSQGTIKVLALAS